MQSLDEKVWQAVEIGWTKQKEAPTDWDEAKIKVANFNSRALNALFSAVTNEEFKKISSIKTAQEAWTILQTTYEGTKAIKDSKLQRLTTSFEEIKMEEDKSFDEFYAKLKDIVNSAFNLGETIPEPKIVRKEIRSLPEIFHAKIKATNFNNKALNALFSEIINEEFKKISLTKNAKEACTILQTTYEGTEAIKDSKLQRLTTSFEEIKIEEDESFDEFYAKLKDIVNSTFNLGETIPEPKVVRKVLRFLLKRFHAKITSIEESKDIDKIPLWS